MRVGVWNSIYHKFRLWCKLGIFENILKIINQEADESSLIEIDSTFCKVHQSACSALKNQDIGSSRGGKNTKIHVLVNERMQMINVVLTGGQVHDSEKAIELFERITFKGKTVLADRAFSSEKIRNKNYRHICHSLLIYQQPLIKQDLTEILDSINFADKIIFGRTNYSKAVSSYPNSKDFYNACAEQVIDFCNEHNINYHIKNGTMT